MAQRPPRGERVLAVLSERTALPLLQQPLQHEGPILPVPDQAAVLSQATRHRGARIQHCERLRPQRHAVVGMVTAVPDALLSPRIHQCEALYGRGAQDGPDLPETRQALGQVVGSVRLLVAPVHSRADGFDHRLAAGIRPAVQAARVPVVPSDQGTHPFPAARPAPAEVTIQRFRGLVSSRLCPSRVRVARFWGCAK